MLYPAQGGIFFAMKLTTNKRKAMPKGEFAGPGRSFPINDKNHARLAISGATRAERAGNISPGEESSIKERARAKLDHPQSHAEFENLGKPAKGRY